MAAVTVSVKTHTSTEGIRSMDPLRDLPAIVDLIEMGFGEELDPQGRKMLSQMRHLANRTLWVRVFYGDAVAPSGFVWVERDCVVGNLSLRPAYPAWRKGMLIGNVVVHPNYRGRGIGRALMEAALTQARTQNAKWVGLEVRDDNAVARELYAHLGFSDVGETVHLLRPQGLPWPAPREVGEEWRRAKPRDKSLWVKLSESVYDEQQGEVLEMRPNLYTFGGWDRKLDLLLRGEREWAWVYRGNDLGMAVRVRTDLAYHFSSWELLVCPQLGIEAAQKAVDRAVSVTYRSHSPRPVVTMVEQRSPVLPSLYALGFYQHRRLVQMMAKL